MDTTVDVRTKRTLHEVCVTLLCLFEVYKAPPALIEHTAQELEAILRRHLADPDEPPQPRGKLALERLLDELEARLEAELRPTTTH